MTTFKDIRERGAGVECGGSPFQDILKNKKIISVNQDLLGIQGRRIYKQKGRKRGDTQAEI